MIVDQAGDSLIENIHMDNERMNMKFLIRAFGRKKSEYKYRILESNSVPYVRCEIIGIALSAKKNMAYCRLALFILVYIRNLFFEMTKG